MTEQIENQSEAQQNNTILTGEVECPMPVERKRKHQRLKRKLTHGVGLLDVDYQVVTRYVDENGNKKIKYCPFYSKWRGMLKRCYSEKYKLQRPSYVGIACVEEWKYFSNFKAWMETQDWEGKELDKDLLVRGNKVYGPETCCFVDYITNCFILDCLDEHGNYPAGYVFDKRDSRYYARCCNPFTKKAESLGGFTCPEDAHSAWLIKKKEHAMRLAELQEDSRVADALVKWFEENRDGK